MDFGIFTMFSTREGSTQSQVFQEWLSLVQVAEDSGLDTLWLGESHFRPHRAADPEAFERLKRISEVGYDDVLSRVAYGTPDAVVERLQEYRETLGITGVSLDVNPGGQIPYDRVVHSIRLLTDKVIPKFR
jgi:alkanesulfonate monooxygenase SsuD/methylene tetrahydromethanopterin reductase-like flavin-dependent oxidoreductase (luciferase family)